MNAQLQARVLKAVPTAPPKANPMPLHPVAWGKPDPRLARGCGISMLTTTPKFRFKGLRALLRSAI